MSPRRRYPSAPVVGVGGVVISPEQAVLLVRRAHPPAQGQWSIPGGVVELGEPLATACKREVAEETGIEVSVGPVVEVVERIRRDEAGAVEYHYVIVDFLCTCSHQPPPIAADDASAARWVRAEELGSLGLHPQTIAVIKKALHMRQGKR